ncbi:alpha-L-arabinofuranosidase C-terminal domain-containing protein [Niabella terrae]
MSAWIEVQAADPDSVYLFAYATTKDQGRSGLCFAWSQDRVHWQSIGRQRGFLHSDYGRWGSEKRMINPVLFPSDKGGWSCVWDLNPGQLAVALAQSKDLISWAPQSYYTAADAPSHLPWKEVQSWRSKRSELQIDGLIQTGTIHVVDYQLVQALRDKLAAADYYHSLWQETTQQDPVRFEGLKRVQMALHPESGAAKKISNMMVGAFFEDINYAADGGLYGELVQNRDFEYDPADRQGRDSSWGAMKAWHLKGQGEQLQIDTQQAIHPNNKHYAVLETTDQQITLANEGFDGIPLKAGQQYDFSIFARSLAGGVRQLRICLVDREGKLVAAANVRGISPNWKKLEVALKVSRTVDSASLEIRPEGRGRVALDMISLFPAQTFKNRKNGLRADLAKVIADMKPKFIRFPGGCVAHGDGLENIYHWKNTVGPLEARKPQRNLWGYHQTAGLGYFEYFQFCEDIGARPLPVVAAGVPCQNSGQHGHPLGGQQGGIPMEDMDSYIQDILDLIEWANGPADSKWGRVRAAAGHPRPFHLEYIGIGNEDLISDVFKERFAMIYQAVKKHHPEITVIGTVGPFFEGSDYQAGWQFADALRLPMVDEHYYVAPGWFIYNQDYYDKYDRNKSAVYLGEYAAHLPGRPNNLETALAEAIHLTALERNADIVKMSSYAPLLAKQGHTQWNPDMIYFNNTSISPRPGYYVQQLFSIHSGDIYIPATAEFSEKNEKITKRIAWSVVRDSSSHTLTVKLVNLLPVPVDLQLKDSWWENNAAETVTRTVLKGAPRDQQLQPLTDTLPLSALGDTQLPPYSLTVLSLQEAQ